MLTIVSFFSLVTYTPGGLSAWGRESPMNGSRYVESPSSSPRIDRRDMDSIDRRRYKGYVYLCTKGMYICVLYELNVVVQGRSIIDLPCTTCLQLLQTGEQRSIGVKKMNIIKECSLELIVLGMFLVQA